jgi:molybdate transport system ATP-binding protein
MRMSFDIALSLRRGDADIDVRIASDRKLTAVIGPSGAGKTSLLHCVAGLLRPDKGRIEVAGETLFNNAAGIDLPPQARRAGYVFQDNRLFPHMRVEANLAYGESRSEASQALMSRAEALQFLGITHLARRYPATLSGGETRRVAIGRALLSSPRFLLLDEPLTSIDRARRADILSLVERIRDEIGLPILYVSHEESEVARLAGEVIELA